MAKRLLLCDAEFKARFIEKYGELEYQKTVEHYSRTNIQLREKKKIEEEAKRIREDAKLKIEQMKAEAYGKQVDLTDEKKASEIKRLLEEIENVKNSPNMFEHKKAELIQQKKEKLALLGYIET